MNFYHLIVCFLLLNYIAARPWNPDNPANSFEVVNQSPTSPLMTTIDSMSSNLAKSLKHWSPNMAPVLSMATLGYLGYIASVMFFPSFLTRAGIPLLEDFKFENRLTRKSESGFVDSLATGIIKDMIARTEAADVLKNTSMNAVSDGLKTFKRTAKFLRTGLASSEGIVSKLLTALTPECLSRYMCQVGQFTSVHMPAVGPMLRSLDAFSMDGYAQALIDGTTIGDCSAVFFECPL